MEVIRKSLESAEKARDRLGPLLEGTINPDALDFLAQLEPIVTTREDAEEELAVDLARTEPPEYLAPLGTVRNSVTTLGTFLMNFTQHDGRTTGDEVFAAVDKLDAYMGDAWPVDG
jgi:hypothetical protein